MKDFHLNFCSFFVQLCYKIEDFLLIFKNAMKILRFF